MVIIYNIIINSVLVTHPSDPRPNVTKNELYPGSSCILCLLLHAAINVCVRYNGGFLPNI